MWVDSVDPGSQYLRSNFSFGAGVARMTMTGEVYDVYRGRLLAKFHHARVAGYMDRGARISPDTVRDNSVYLLEVCGKRLGGDIGQMLAAFHEEPAAAVQPEKH